MCIRMGFSEQITVVLTIFIVVWLGWRALNWAWFRPKKMERRLRQLGLSGNPYNFLHGDLREGARMKATAKSKPMSSFSNDALARVNPTLFHTVQKHGLNSFFWEGPVPVVIVSQPELITEVFNNQIEFPKPKQNPLFNLLSPGLPRHEGDKWSKHRKLVRPSFQMDKLKLLLPAFHTCCNEMVERWEKIIAAAATSERGHLNTNSSRIELDVRPHLSELAADVISRAAFGSSFEEGRRIFELIRQETDLAVKISGSVYIPGWRYLPTSTNRKLMKVEKELHALLTCIIEKRKKHMKAEEASKGDLLGIMMENCYTNGISITNNNNNYNNNNNNNNKKKKKKLMMTLTEDELMNECRTFYFAGQETSSTLLVWTMILLARHQDWQERGRKEVFKVFGKDDNNSTISFDGLNQLKTITMILNEVMRLYPPALQLSRTTTAKHDVKLGGLSLPAGVHINLALILCHHDPAHWGDDALEFKPERFAEGNLKAAGGKVAFFPFGWGPRICIGQNFALVEAKMAVAMILKHFEFELSPSYTHAPWHHMTIQPQHGAHLILRKVL